MRGQLEVYYDSNCATALITQELVSSVRNLRPGLSIEVVDLNMPNVRLPKTIFAVPVYLWNGNPIFLGNPTRQALIDRLCTS
jgi:hypothetical protein